MGIMWNEHLLVDWREGEWGVRKTEDDFDDDTSGILSTQLDPDFGLDGGSLL